MFHRGGVESDLSSSPPSESGDQAQEVTNEAPATIRPEFYEAFKRQAGVFDKELKEYNKELNVTLLFVSDPLPQNRLRLTRISV